MSGDTGKAQLAASNNADLCEAIFKAHNLGSTRNPACLRCVETPPPLYPNLVTLTPQLRADDIKASQGTGAFGSIKDSFSNLDPSPLGMRVLFDATWIYREPAQMSAPLMPMGWKRAETTSALNAWHQAWSASDTGIDALVFPPACLENPSLIFLAHLSEGNVTAGCLANLSNGSMGLSNVFSLSQDTTLSVEAAQAASTFAPGSPLVGYESGDDLDAAQDAGFSAVGPLRILVG